MWARSFPNRDATVAVIRFAGFERDIAERKRAEEPVRSLLTITRELRSTFDVDALMVTLVRETLRLLEAGGGCAGLMTPLGMACRRFCTEGEVIGFIHLVNKKDGSGFDRPDQEKLTAVSRAASMAVQNALAYHKLREVSGLLLQSQNQERRRIARELHDSTAQSLAALAMNLSLIGRAAAALDPKTRRRLSDSVHLTEQSCREIRTLSYLLHPPELDDADLWSGVTLVVRDEGRGLRAVRPRRPRREILLGVGIAGMRERVRQLGGQIEIDSSARGTCV